MSVPICAGPTCRCLALSSRCCEESSISPATRRLPARVSRPRPARRPWRHCARLDGFGAFGPPPSTAKPLPADYRERASLDHPPGFYGPADGPLAVNALAAADRIAPLDTSALKARHASYTSAEPRDLRGMLLSTALALFLIDAIIVALLGGGFAALMRRRAAPAVLAIALALSMLNPTPSRADAASDDFAIKAVAQTRLAYVITGNADVDSIVKAGLNGLTLFLAPAHRAGSRRAGGHRSRPRRTGVLPADLLADRARFAKTAAGRHQPHRRLHEAGRHGAVRHPRRRGGAARTGRRIADPGHADLAKYSLVPRRARARASAARARADQNVLPAARFSGPLQFRTDMGRDFATRRRR